MKACFFDISARQTGKTHQLIEMIKRPNSKNIIICKNLPMLDNLLHRGYIDRVNNHFFTIQTFKSRVSAIGMSSLAYDNAFIDEYLGFGADMGMIYKYLPSMVLENVYIKTSPYKMYNQNIFELVKTLKSDGLDNIIDGIYFTTSDYGDQANELYYNFITDSRTTVRSSYHDCENIVSKEQRELQLGKIWE